MSEPKLDLNRLIGWYCFGYADDNIQELQEMVPVALQVLKQTQSDYAALRKLAEAVVKAYATSDHGSIDDAIYALEEHLK